MSKWIVGFLAAVLTLSAIAGVGAQEEPADPETVNVDVTVWRRVSDPTLLYVSTRPEGGRWRTLNTPLDMSMRSDSGNFDQSNAVRVRVPLEGGGTANVDVTVWRRVSDPTLLYVSTRPEGGRWRTLNTPLDMSMRSDSGNFHQSNAVRVEVPLPGLPAYTCINASRHTPLHTAVDAADTQLVRIISASCPQYLDNVSGEFFYDQTPLSLAIGGGEAGIVQILVNAGADPDRRIEPAFRVGTHLTYAIGLAEYDIAKILLDADADPNVVDKEQFYDQTPLSLAILRRGRRPFAQPHRRGSGPQQEDQSRLPSGNAPDLRGRAGQRGGRTDSPRRRGGPERRRQGAVPRSDAAEPGDQRPRPGHAAEADRRGG